MAVLNSSRQKQLIETSIDELREQEADVREDIIQYKKRCRSICNLQDKLMNTDKNEFLLSEDHNRYVMFPIKDQDIWKMYQKQEDLFWRAQEVDLSKDTKDWETLTAVSYTHLTLPTIYSV